MIARVLSGCADDIEALEFVLSESSLVADDAERISRIDALYLSMEDRYTFAKAFHNECSALAVARQQELSGIRRSREILNLNETP